LKRFKPSLKDQIESSPVLAIKQDMVPQIENESENKYEATPWSGLPKQETAKAQENNNRYKRETKKTKPKDNLQVPVQLENPNVTITIISSPPVYAIPPEKNQRIEEKQSQVIIPQEFKAEIECKLNGTLGQPEQEPSERTNFSQFENNSRISTSIGKKELLKANIIDIPPQSKIDSSLKKSPSALLLSDFANHTVKAKPKKPTRSDVNFEIVLSEEEKPRENAVIKSNKDDIVLHDITSPNSKEDELSNINKAAIKTAEELFITGILTNNLNRTEINTQQSVSINQILGTKAVNLKAENEEMIEKEIFVYSKTLSKNSSKFTSPLKESNLKSDKKIFSKSTFYLS
jgi:hypothetical protein